MMSMRGCCWIGLGILLLGLAGCADQRQDLVVKWVQVNVPAGLEVVELGEFEIPEVDESGTTVVELPVRYRLLREAVDVIDGLGGGEGAELAARMDAVRQWAVENLEDGDAVRTAIEQTWNRARHGYLLKTLAAPDGTEVNGTARLTLNRPNGDWEIAESDLQVELPGRIEGVTAIPYVGSNAAALSWQRTVTMTETLEQMRENWLAAAERRAQAAVDELAASLKTGMAYAGMIVREPIRMVVSRGRDIADPSIVVVSDARAPQSSVRFEGSIERGPKGSALWKGRRTDVIASFDTSRRFFAEDGGVEELILRVDGGGLVGDAEGLALAFGPGQEVDVLPEIGSDEEPSLP